LGYLIRKHAGPFYAARAAGIGKDLAELSLDTVKMFYDDAKKAGFSL